MEIKKYKGSIIGVIGYKEANAVNYFEDIPFKETIMDRMIYEIELDSTSDLDKIINKEIEIVDSNGSLFLLLKKYESTHCSFWRSWKWEVSLY